MLNTSDRIAKIVKGLMSFSEKHSRRTIYSNLFKTVD